MKKLIYLITVVVLVLNFSCKDSGTGPEEKKSVRDYTWTVDTIAYEGASQTLMSSVWGSSASNVYICGHTDIGYGKLWRYTGFIWKHIDVFQDVPIGPISLEDVHGTASDNIWVVGSRFGTNPAPPPNFLHQSLILQYNGSKWIEHNVKTKSKVFALHVNSPTDVWACGADGIVYHYDGINWELDTLKVNISEGDQYNLFSITGNSSLIYAHAAVFENNGSRSRFYLFQRENEEWLKVDSFAIDNQNNQWKWGANHLFFTSFGKLYGNGYGIYERSGKDWITILPQNFASFRGFYELGKDNMMGVGDGGEVYHYNGTDWKLLENLKNENVLYTGVWMDKNEVFIIGHLLVGFPQKTIVLRGK